MMTMTKESYDALLVLAMIAMICLTGLIGFARHIIKRFQTTGAKKWTKKK